MTTLLQELSGIEYMLEQIPLLKEKIHTLDADLNTFMGLGPKGDQLNRMIQDRDLADAIELNEKFISHKMYEKDKLTKEMEMYAKEIKDVKDALIEEMERYEKEIKEVRDSLIEQIEMYEKKIKGVKDTLTEEMYKKEIKELKDTLTEEMYKKEIKELKDTLTEEIEMYEKEIKEIKEVLTLIMEF
jgi:chromosome segregation ATPase